MKKAMLLTSQAVFDAMEEHKEAFINGTQFLLKNYPKSSEETEKSKEKLIEDFKKKVNDSAFNKVASKYPAIKNKYQEAYDWVHGNFHPDDDLELTAGETYFAMFIAIKQTNAPTTRAGMLDSIQKGIIEEAFRQSDNEE